MTPAAAAHWRRTLTGDPRGTSAQRTRRMMALAAIGRTHEQVLARNIDPRRRYAAEVQARASEVTE